MGGGAESAGPPLTIQSSLAEASRVALSARQVQRLLGGIGHEPTLEDLAATFPYPLDRVQAKAIQMFLDGASVVVCAPTGAGKTAIAEAAALAVLARCGS